MKFAAIIGIGSIIFGSWGNVFGKKLMNKDSAFALVFYFSIFVTIFSAIWVTIQGNWQMPNIENILILTLAGLVGNINKLWAMMAYKMVSTTFFGILSYLAIPLSAIAGIIFFDEIPNIYTIIGIGVILIAIIWHFIIERKENKCI